MIYAAKHCLGFAITALLFALRIDASAEVFPKTPERPGIEISQPDWLLETSLEEGGSDQTSLTSFPTSLYLSGTQNFTLSGAPGETVTLSLKDFALTGSATLTLEGTATTKFIVSVGRRFSLSGSSAITLAGGVDLTNVLFKISRRGTALVSGNSVLRGIVSAPQRTLRLRQNALVYGRVTARKTLISGNARIIPPAVSQ